MSSLPRTKTSGNDGFVIEDNHGNFFYITDDAYSGNLKNNQWAAETR